jgi:hypothetical protein
MGLLNPVTMMIQSKWTGSWKWSTLPASNPQSLHVTESNKCYSESLKSKLSTFCSSDRTADHILLLVKAIMLVGN